jgi:hypothetical protein
MSGWWRGADAASEGKTIKSLSGNICVVRQWLGACWLIVVIPCNRRRLAYVLVCLRHRRLVAHIPRYCGTMTEGDDIRCAHAVNSSVFAADDAGLTLIGYVAAG